MKLQFDANQQYQLDAVAAVTDLFEGQPQGTPEYSPIEMGDWGGLFAGQARTALGVGNHLLLAPEKLLAGIIHLKVGRTKQPEATPELRSLSAFSFPGGVYSRVGAGYAVPARVHAT